MGKSVEIFLHDYGKAKAESILKSWNFRLADISQAPPKQIAAIVVISFHGFGGEKN